MPGLRIIGTAHEKAGVLSFVLDECRSRRTSARRSTGKASPCARATTARSRSCAASGSRRRCVPRSRFYNTCGEIDVLVSALKDIQAETGLALA